MEEELELDRDLLESLLVSLNNNPDTNTQIDIDTALNPKDDIDMYLCLGMYNGILIALNAIDNGFNKDDMYDIGYQLGLNALGQLPQPKGMGLAKARVDQPTNRSI